MKEPINASFIQVDPTKTSVYREACTCEVLSKCYSDFAGRPSSGRISVLRPPAALITSCAHGADNAAKAFTPSGERGAVGVLPSPSSQAHASQNKRHFLAGVYTIMDAALILADLGSDHMCVMGSCGAESGGRESYSIRGGNGHPVRGCVLIGIIYCRHSSLMWIAEGFM